MRWADELEIKIIDYYQKQENLKKHKDHEDHHDNTFSDSERETIVAEFISIYGVSRFFCG